jgi:hypothetical protein
MEVLMGEELFVVVKRAKKGLIAQRTCGRVMMLMFLLLTEAVGDQVRFVVDEAWCMC